MAYELSIKKNTFTNPKLAQLATEMNSAIMAVGAMAEKTKVMCAKHLHTIEAESLYKDDGYENYIDFTMEVMGMKRANAFAYAQVGRAIHLDQIKETDANGNAFTFTQLRAMAAAKDVKKLSDAVESGEIAANMTASEVEEAVREMNPKKNPRKAPAEKRYLWEEVGPCEEHDSMSKTEVISYISAEGGTYIGELKSDDDFYLVAIAPDGFPWMFRRSTEVKKVVEQG